MNREKLSALLKQIAKTAFTAILRGDKETRFLLKNAGWIQAGSHRRRSVYPCCVEDEVKEYQAEITKIDMNHSDTNKSFVIRVPTEASLDNRGNCTGDERAARSSRMEKSLEQ